MDSETRLAASLQEDTGLLDAVVVDHAKVRLHIATAGSRSSGSSIVNAE